jgi:hypothetical protein
MSLFITILGCLGAAALLLAYGMVSTSRMSGEGLTYQAPNLFGAIALMINSAYHSAWPSATLNIIWSGIGAVAISRVVAARARARKPTSTPEPALECAS